MTQEKLNKVRSLFEELHSICSGANLGNGREPVWDGTVISKPNQHVLVSMGLVECHYGYYFPTRLGTALCESLFGDKHAKLVEANQVYTASYQTLYQTLI